MKKLFISVITAVMIIVNTVPAVNASGALFVDDAGLLDNYENQQITELLEAAGEKHDASFVIVTTDDTEGKSMQDYADDFFDYGGYSYDGMLLLIDMDRGDYYISTCGKYNTQEVNLGALDVIENNMPEKLKEGDFYGAFKSFANDCSNIDNISEESRSSGSSGHGSRSVREPFDWFGSILVCIVIGIVVAFISTSVMKGQLKSVKQQTRAENYVVDGSMNVTESRDMFLYHHISRTPRPKSNSGSGGSHRSSSGRSHGGRGGSFR